MRKTYRILLFALFIFSNSYGQGAWSYVGTFNGGNCDQPFYFTLNDKGYVGGGRTAWNVYKDDFWEYPEFAQQMDVFCKLVDAIEHPNFGVNYDPSNTFLTGEDPLELLRRVSHRVVTMHASDRYLKYGTIEDLKKEEGGAVGYAKRLSHGEIGKGMNDYDAIFTELKRVSFDGWISIEDGVDGMDQLERSVEFLKRKIGEYWG